MRADQTGCGQLRTGFFNVPVQTITNPGDEELPRTLIRFKNIPFYRVLSLLELSNPAVFSLVALAQLSKKADSLHMLWYALDVNGETRIPPLNPKTWNSLFAWAKVAYVTCGSRVGQQGS